jgi:hypothetical protein
MIMYWNFYQLDELITTKWRFWAYIEELGLLGGLLNIAI